MRLLLAIDVHDHSDQVLAAAAEWVERLDATLDLVYVNTFGSYLPYLHAPGVTAELEDELDTIRSEEANQLRALMDSLPEEHRGATHLVTGDPAASIADFSRSYDALLVATHGRTGLAHLWMGSVSEHLMRRCEVPVIVLRLPAEEAVGDQ